MSAWNPRYLAYCRATGGLSPDATLARDRARYPGGVNAGFAAWTAERWREWDARGGGTRGPRSAAEQAAFDAWLDGGTQTELALEAA